MLPRSTAQNQTGLCLSIRPALLLTLLLLGLGVDVRADPADTEVCGPITVDTIWTVTSSPYIVTCDVQVVSGVTLTIGAGVTVKFDAGTSLRVDGTLVAEGAAFTSNQADPVRGDWGHIFFTASSGDAVFDAEGNYVSGSALRNCIVEWGGGAGVNGAVETASASPFLERNTVQNNGNSGIYALGRSPQKPVVIRENGIIGNQMNLTDLEYGVAYGGGIYTAQAKVSGNTISGNTVSGGLRGTAYGGGIYATASAVYSNTVTNNSASCSAIWCSTYGGGIHATNCTLVGNTVSGNSASAHWAPTTGGGVYASGGTLSDNTVSGNSAESDSDDHAQGGGVYAVGSTLIGNTLDGNTATGDPAEGGGVYLTSGTLTDNEIRNNLATSGGEGGEAYGGGVYTSLSELSGNTVDDNTAQSTDNRASGGGLYASGGSVTGNTITDNTATAPGSNNVGYGGGIYANGGTVSGNTVSGNTASGGGDSQGGGVYGQANTVQGNTLTGNSANRGGAIYIHQGTATDNDVLTNTTALSGTLYVEGGTATLNLLKGNTAAYGGGLYGDQAQLAGNTVQSNGANYGGGIYAYRSTVRNNTLTHNTAQSDGGGVYANAGTCTGNTMSHNSVNWGHGSGAYLIGTVDFSYNNVLTNTGSGGAAGGVSIDGHPQVSYNNLYSNQPYDADVVSSSDVTATFNYWGPSTCTAIAGQVYDGSDAPGRGHLLYSPSLYSPIPLAQLPAPMNLAIVADTSAVTLTWMPVPALPGSGCRPPGYTGPEVGYRVYYDTDRPCPPYTGRGLPQGNSPIDVGDATTYTLSGAAQYIAVTAYDMLGRESWYSNEATNQGTNFTASPTSGFAPLTVVFTNTSTGGYTTSLWNFGDGVTSTQTSPTHVYALPSVYTITLTVTWPDRTHTLTRTNYITVYEPVQADFSASPRSGDPPLIVQFTDMSSGPVATWEWSFGDGETSALQHPTHTYVTTRAYTVSLTVRAAGGSAAWPGGTDTLTRIGYINAGGQHRIYLPLILRSP